MGQDMLAQHPHGFCFIGPMRRAEFNATDWSLSSHTLYLGYNVFRRTIKREIV